MSAVSPNRIMCFDCVEPTDRFSSDGVDSVCCPRCLKVAPLEKALDDCFVFIVASAVDDRLKKNFSRGYGFMPLVGDRPTSLHNKSQMVGAGCARSAA